MVAALDLALLVDAAFRERDEPVRALVRGAPVRVGVRGGGVVLPEHQRFAEEREGVRGGVVEILSLIHI